MPSWKKVAFTGIVAFSDKIAFTDILLGQPTFYNYVNAEKMTLFCVHEGKKETKIAKWPSRTYHFHEGKQISTKASVKAIFATKAAYVLR